MIDNHRLQWHVRYLGLRWTTVLLCGLALVVVNLQSRSAVVSPQDRTAATNPTITSAPEYNSDAKSVEILDVSLAESKGGRKVVRIRMRNLVDEAVIGLEFDMHGADPHAGRGYGELTQLRAETLLPVIEPKGEHVTEIPAVNFKLGDKLRLAAVLYASGRGEGDVALVDDMRREAASSQPPVPQNAPN